MFINDLKKHTFKTDLKEHIADTYFSARIWFAALGILLPFILSIGGYKCANAELQHSMSHYYHCGGLIRDLFVGLLFFLGMALILYKGFTVFEDWALNLAGFSVVMAALIPTPDKSGGYLSWHGFFAALFFFFIVYVFIFRSLDTLSLITNKKRKNCYKTTYWSLGCVILFFIVLAFILSSAKRLNSETRVNIFVPEALAVLAFGVYWGIKSYEIYKTQCELEAIEGKLIVIEYGLSDLIKPICVKRREPAKK